MKYLFFLFILNTCTYNVEKRECKFRSEQKSFETVVESDTNVRNIKENLFFKKVCFSSDTIGIFWEENVDDIEIMPNIFLNRKLVINSKINIDIDSILINSINRSTSFSDSIKPIQYYRYVSFSQQYYKLCSSNQIKSINILLFDNACLSDCYTYYVVNIYFNGTNLIKSEFKLYESHSGIPRI